MPYATVLSQRGWEQFKINFADANELDVATVSWGKGPQAFPCHIAASVAPQERRVICCYYYPDDARALLAHCVLGGDGGDAEREDQVSPPEPDSLAAEVATLHKKLAALRDEFRHYAISCNAHLRVHLQRGFHTGFYNRDEYEKSYLASMAYIDQLDEATQKDPSLKTLHPE
jgi:hypothetical protein